MLELLPNCGNQKTTKESTYMKKNMSEINDIVELPGGIYFLLKHKTTDQHQRKDPRLLAKYKNHT